MKRIVSPQKRETIVYKNQRKANKHSRPFFRPIACIVCFVIFAFTLTFNLTFDIRQGWSSLLDQPEESSEFVLAVTHNLERLNLSHKSVEEVRITLDHLASPEADETGTKLLYNLRFNMALRDELRDGEITLSNVIEGESNKEKEEEKKRLAEVEILKEKLKRAREDQSELMSKYEELEKISEEKEEQSKRLEILQKKLKRAREDQSKLRSKYETLENTNSDLVEEIGKLKSTMEVGRETVVMNKPKKKPRINGTRNPPNLLMTTYFIHQKDPIIRKGGKMHYNISIIENFLSNVHSFLDKMHVVLFVDWKHSLDLPIEFIYVNYTNEYVNYSINDYRFYLFHDYLKSHLEFEQALIVDFSDVLYGRDPFELMHSMKDKKIFVGSEVDRKNYGTYGRYKLWYCWGRKYRSRSPTRLIKAYKRAVRGSEKDPSLLMNAGIFGGDVSYVVDILEDMTGQFSNYTDPHVQGCNSNMLVFLTAVTPYHKKGLVFTGAPFNSPFQEFLEPSSDYAIFHKRTEIPIPEEPMIFLGESSTDAKFITNKNCREAWNPYFEGAEPTTGFIPGTMDYIVVAGRLTCVLAWNIFSILKYQNPRRVLIVTLASVCDDMLLPPHVRCIDEETWVPGLNMDMYRAYFESKMDTIGSRIFWYWQQMLKMGSVFRNDLSDEFVLVDADVIFQRHFMYKNSDGQYIFNSGGGKPRPYDDPVQRFLGHAIHNSNDGLTSFVSHSLIVKKSFLRSCLEIHDKLWWKEIIDLASRQYRAFLGAKKWLLEMQRLYGFSEYMYYTSAFIENFPDQYVESPSTQFIRDREIKNRFGDYCPTLESMQLIRDNSDGQQDVPIIVWELEHGKLSQGSKDDKNAASLHSPYPSCEDSPK